VDEITGLKIGLPTIAKSINGEIGSFRPYIPSDIAETPNFLRRLGHRLELSNFYKSKDMLRMACLDELVSNCDRTPDNFLIYLNHPNRAVSIDMGSAFYSAKPNDSREIINYFRANPEGARIDDEIEAGLRNLVASEETLLAPLNLGGDDEITLDSDDKRIARLLYAHDTFNVAKKMLRSGNILARDY
jgi:hypothetical protein